MRLRFISRVTARLALLFLLASLVPAAGAVPDVVRVTFQPFQSNGALFIADREGYFGAEGIQIRWAPAPFLRRSSTWSPRDRRSASWPTKDTPPGEAPWGPW